MSFKTYLGIMTASILVTTASAEPPAAAPSSTARPAPAPAAPVLKHLDIMKMEEGVWDADITFPSNDPAKPDGKAKGVQTNRLKSGGLWMVNEFSVDGTPYEGTGIWGYDRITNRFVGMWVDNNYQQMRFDDGRWNAEKQTMVWTSNVVDPDGFWVRYLATAEMKGDTRIFDMVALTRKGAVPQLHIVFTRRPDTKATPGAR
jgi:hypothetical protein